ncbi:hypothetical protein EVAR_93826_1 [Eumeta japonica]|uniref:Uncharacterized protein n=1 Tax=Eumeta variegata TaxID=151549 RepID=A0A4C1TX19_EUMVA|nr:hypothetical protein EVAR_93826_1 [Eumeta japonica]
MFVLCGNRTHTASAARRITTNCANLAWIDFERFFLKGYTPEGGPIVTESGSDDGVPDRALPLSLFCSDASVDGVEERRRLNALAGGQRSFARPSESRDIYHFSRNGYPMTPASFALPCDS